MNKIDKAENNALENKVVFDLLVDEAGQEETLIQETVPEEAQEAPVQETIPEEQKTKCRMWNSKKLVLIGIAAVVILAAIIGAFVLFDERTDNSGLYFRDYEMYLVNNSADNRYAITKHFCLNDNLDKGDYVDLADEVGESVVITEKGNRIFFPDKWDSMWGGINLYYRELGRKNDQPVRIDADVMDYWVNDDGSKVIYIKGSEKNLYVHNLKTRTRIATGVKQVSVSENCDKVAFLDKNNNFYLWEDNKEPVKLATEIEDVYYHPDLAHFYYIKEEGFYKQLEGSEDREKLAENISQVVWAYDTGELYYVKENVLEIKLADYVTDDKLQEDKEIKEPAKPAYPSKPYSPSYWSYRTTAAYNKAYEKYKADLKEYEETYEKMKKEYEEAYARYEEKLFRDELREDLKEAKDTHIQYFLYHHNGAEEILLTDALTRKTDINYSTRKAVAFYNVYNSTEIEKVKLSTLKSISEVRSRVNDALFSATDVYIAVGANTSLLEEENADNMVIAPDCSSIYFLEGLTSDGSGDLYCMNINTEEGTVSLPELYDSEVSSHYDIKFIREDSRIVYAKNYRKAKGIGDLYVNGQLLDYDVELNGIIYLENSMAYFADWNNNQDFGVLKIRNIDTQTDTVISEDVHDYMFTSGGDILYLRDYRTQYDTGDLYFYDRSDATSEMVAYEVIALIKPVDTKSVVINSSGLSEAQSITLAEAAFAS